MSASEDRIYWQQIDTPVGELLLAGSALALREIRFQGGPHPRPAEQDWIADAAPLRAARVQLEEYFAGRRREFALELAPCGTAFQRAVWSALREIPYGTTISYAQLARRIGNRKATRAVGLANGANPLPIVIPCHRVIGSDGSLTGFGGGVEIKRRLLDLEASRSTDVRLQSAFPF